MIADSYNNIFLMSKPKLYMRNGDMNIYFFSNKQNLYIFFYDILSDMWGKINILENIKFSISF